MSFLVPYLKDKARVFSLNLDEDYEDDKNEDGEMSSIVDDNENEGETQEKEAGVTEGSVSRNKIYIGRYHASNIQQNLRVLL